MNTVKTYDEYISHLTNPNLTFFYVYDKGDNFSNTGKLLLDNLVKNYHGADFCSIEKSENPELAKKLQIAGSPAIFFGHGGQREPTTRIAATNPQIIVQFTITAFSRRGITKNT